MSQTTNVLQDSGTSVSRLITEVFEEKDYLGLIQKFSAESKTVGLIFSQTGIASYQRLSEEGELAGESLIMDFLVNYLWAEEAKNFLLLWRDSLFELTKAYLLFSENIIGKQQLKLLRDSARSKLDEASDWLGSFLEIELKNLKQKKNGIKTFISKYRLQTNPWPVYKKQIELIPAQCTDLMDGLQLNNKISITFKSIKTLVTKTLRTCQDETMEITGLMKLAVKMIEEEMSFDDPRKIGRIAVKLEEIETKTKLIPHLNDFLTLLDEKLDSLPSNTKITVGTGSGLLIQKELNLKKKVQQWLESEILPLFYEIWELTESASHGAKMTLSNLRNRAILLSSENKDARQIDYTAEDLTKPLYSFMRRLKDYDSNIIQLEGISDQRLEKHFKFSPIFNTAQEFLPTPIQYQITTLPFDQIPFLSKFLKWIWRKAESLRTFIKTFEHEEELSSSEKIVRYIISRTQNTDNSHYSSIFLTKGFVGESFALGRDKEIEQVKHIVENWKIGFRGAILLTGQRFCGKTLFAELIAYRYFPESTIRLMPGAILNLNGRKLEISYDLNEALQFIRKHTINERQLILIDDLETWWDPQHPLLKNLGALNNFIDTFSSKHFFIVTIGRGLKTHLSNSIEIDRIFQAELNLDKLALEEVHDAIIVRHGATHKTLVDEKHEEISSRKLSKLIKRIYKVSKGNIGEALNIWSYSTRRLDQDSVINDFSRSYPFPDFLYPDSALLLVSIFLQKRTNEYRLRKLFGPAFNEKYSSVVQRLLNIGILSRQLDGSLEINEVVVNDLGRLLHRKDYFK